MTSPDLAPANSSTEVEGGVSIEYAPIASEDWKKLLDDTDGVVPPNEFPLDFFTKEGKDGTKITSTRNGLSAEQKIAIIKRNTININKICRTRGEGKLLIAQQLAEIKDQYVDKTNKGLGKWLKYLDGGYVGVSKENARMLVSAWENWLGKPDENGELPEVPGWIVDSWSARTAQILACIEDDPEKGVIRAEAQQKAIDITRTYLGASPKEIRENKFPQMSPSLANNLKNGKDPVKPRKIKSKEQLDLAAARKNASQKIRITNNDKEEGTDPSAEELKELSEFMNLSSSLLQMKEKIGVMQKTLGSVDLDTYYVKEFTKEMKEKKLPICSDEKLKALLSAIG